MTPATAPRGRWPYSLCIENKMSGPTTRQLDISNSLTFQLSPLKYMLVCLFLPFQSSYYESHICTSLRIPIAKMINPHTFMSFVGLYALLTNLCGRIPYSRRRMKLPTITPTIPDMLRMSFTIDSLEISNSLLLFCGRLYYILYG